MISKPAPPPSTETVRPDVGISWTRWDFRGEQWCVPVLDFMVAKGVPSATVVANLKRKAGKTYYGNELLEGSYYVAPGSAASPNGGTWAPAQELLELLNV